MPTTLHYREGNSDKIYQTDVQPSGDGFIVTFAYGRRGATLQTGSKTPTPVSREDAEKIAGKLISSKMAKGYTPAESGSPYRMTGYESDDSGIRPQLLNPVEESELPRLLGDHRHILQEKHDGRRMLVWKVGGEIRGINRRGLFVALPEGIVEAAGHLPVDCLIDGEAVGHTLHAFDLLEVGGIDVRQRSYHDRLEGLVRILGGSHSIRAVHTAILPEDKRRVFDKLRTDGAEGVVFKDSNSHYTAGRPASGGGQLKFKFVATASFIVGSINKRRSVALVLLSGDKPVPAGNVAIPPSQGLPATGEVIEVRYLYALEESGFIYQPVFQRRRDDIDASDCQTRQLKFKVKIPSAD
jgi:bifunctional non-homologous end joining protein LigD